MKSKTKQGICPACGSTDLVYADEPESEGVNLISYAFTCNGCGVEGRETYITLYQRTLTECEPEDGGDYPPTTENSLCITDYSHFEDILDT